MWQNLPVAPHGAPDLLEDLFHALEAVSQDIPHSFDALSQELLQFGLLEGPRRSFELAGDALDYGYDNEVHSHLVNLVANVLFYAQQPLFLTLALSLLEGNRGENHSASHFYYFVLFGVVLN